MSVFIEKLIINEPYKEPQRHWLYDRNLKEFTLREGRRKSGY